MIETRKIESLSEGVPGGVFVDNLTFVSVHRLLYDRYEELGEILASTNPSVACAVFLHDVANLANLLDAVLCSDILLTNADFVHLWSGGSDNRLGNLLERVVVGIDVPLPVRRAIESASHAELGANITAPSFTELVNELGSMRSLFYGSHMNRTRPLTPPGTSEAHARRRTFLPYERTDAVYSPDAEIAVGLGFYLSCSQMIGAPFRPSVIRSSLLADQLKKEIANWRLRAGELPLSILEESGADALRAMLEKLHSVNTVDRPAPAVLSYVLNSANEPEDVLPLLMQLRDSDEGQAYRHWSQQFAEKLQAGSLAEISRYQREITKVVDDLNKRFRIANARSTLDLSVGWGPVEIGRTFNLPSALNIPVHIKRHMWIMYHLYKFILTAPHWGADATRVLVEKQPNWMKPSLRHLDWDRIGGRFSGSL